jgi:hypothetical protein
MSDKKFYVYEHWRPDRGECFYVGKGCGNRANVMTNRRSAHHLAIQRKLSRLSLCVEVRIVQSGLTNEEANGLEMIRIAFWRNDGADLVNHTDGGDGQHGRKQSEETRRKISISLKGRPKSPEHCAKVGLAHKGKQWFLGKKRSPQDCAAISARLTARKLAPESIEKMRTTKIKAGISPEARAKMIEGQRAWLSDPENKKQLSNNLPRVRASRTTKAEE